MTIKHDNDFTLNGVKSDFCMKVAGANTVAVLARIRVRPTSNRAGPPKCGNGFETAYLAFAKGHVIALELGGSDHANNVVPQFEHWQGKPNGAWRAMELSYGKYAGRMMLVEIHYKRTGGQQTPEAMRASFEADRLIDWTDERIPSGFDTSVWPSDGVDLSAITDDAAFDKQVTALKSKGKLDGAVFDLGNALPEPDRSMYIVQAGITIAQELANKYETPPNDAPDDWEPPMTPISFLMEEETLPEIRKRLRDVDSVSDTEAANFQLQPMILAMHSTTVPKLRKKYTSRVKQGHKMVQGQGLEPLPKKTKK